MAKPVSKKPVKKSKSTKTKTPKIATSKPTAPPAAAPQPTPAGRSVTEFPIQYRTGDIQGLTPEGTAQRPHLKSVAQNLMGQMSPVELVDLLLLYKGVCEARAALYVDDPETARWYAILGAHLHYALHRASLAGLGPNIQIADPSLFWPDGDTGTIH